MINISIHTGGTSLANKQVVKVAHSINFHSYFLVNLVAGTRRFWD